MGIPKLKEEKSCYLQTIGSVYRIGHRGHYFIVRKCTAVCIVIDHCNSVVELNCDKKKTSPFVFFCSIASQSLHWLVVRFL